MKNADKWLVFSKLRGSSNKSRAYFDLVLENQHQMFYQKDKCIMFIFPKKNICYFGLWETIDDKEANQKMFNQALIYAKQKNYQNLVGPVDGNLYLKSHLAKDYIKPIFQVEVVNENYMDKLLVNSCKIVTIINKKESAQAISISSEISSSYHCVPFESKYFTKTSLNNLWGGYKFGDFEKSEEDINRCIKYINLFDNLDNIMILDNTTIIGYCIVEIKNNNLACKTMAVHKNFRKQGVGKAMINYYFKKYPNYNFYGLQGNIDNLGIKNFFKQIVNVRCFKEYNLYQISNE